MPVDRATRNTLEVWSRRLDRSDWVLCRLAARCLGVAPADVTIVSDGRSPAKLVRIAGLDQATLDAALGR
jgi:hypothetical protein